MGPVSRSKDGPSLAPLGPGNNGEMVVIAKIHRSVLVPTHPPSPPPSTGLGAGLLRQPALAGSSSPRQGCAGGELLSRPAFAVRSSFFVAVFLWCNLRLLNEYSGSQAASGPGPLAWH